MKAGHEGLVGVRQQHAHHSLTNFYLTVLRKRATAAAAISPGTSGFVKSVLQVGKGILEDGLQQGACFKDGLGELRCLGHGTGGSERSDSDRVNLVGVGDNQSKI